MLQTPVLRVHLQGIPLRIVPFQMEFDNHRMPKNNTILFINGFHLKRKSPQGDLKQETSLSLYICVYIYVLYLSLYTLYIYIYYIYIYIYICLIICLDICRRPVLIACAPLGQLWRWRSILYYSTIYYI